MSTQEQTIEDVAKQVDYLIIQRDDAYAMIEKLRTELDERPVINLHPQDLAIVRLGNAHYHMWPHHIVMDHAGRIDLAATSLAIASNTPAPVRPAYNHRTATGRVSWAVDSDGGVVIEVWRPMPDEIGAIGDTGYCVVLARVSLDDHGWHMQYWEAGAACEDRHLDAAYQCLDALGVKAPKESPWDASNRW